jgi:CubicO group peptidase (beta-lactamase class C family)
VTFTNWRAAIERTGGEPKLGQMKPSPVPFSRLQAIALASSLVMLLGTGSVPAQTDRDAPEAQPAASEAMPVLNTDETQRIVGRAKALGQLDSLIVAHRGEPVLEHAVRGRRLDEPVNIKSVAKTIVSALVGIAIDRKVLEGVRQPIASVLKDRFPPDPDPRLQDITIEHLLTMRAGLERTSGANYGRWVSSPNWVRFALARPFVDEPGGRMLYSTGSSHLLSAILTEATEQSTLDLARAWLGKPLDISIPPWERDPQGIYLGGNQMALSPRALLRFGELYRNGGMADGKRVLSEEWIRASWTQQTASPHTGHGYGYGWFITRMNDRPVYYAWGYGGQMLYGVPSLELTIVMTSDPSEPSGRSGYVRDLHALVADEILPSVEPQQGG